MVPMLGNFSHLSPSMVLGKGGGSQQLYFHDFSELKSQVTPQGHHW